MKQFRFLAASVVLGLAGTNLARSQSFSIPWYSIDGGGGTSTGGGFTIHGTIGQPDAGTMSDGSYTLTGGFWSILTAVATEGAPVLSIVMTGPNTALVSWPLPATGFVLQQNAALGPANWAIVATPPVDNGGIRSVNILTSPGHWFFRLYKP
jgi:hypothetical protein